MMQLAHEFAEERSRQLRKYTQDLQLEETERTMLGGGSPSAVVAQLRERQRLLQEQLEHPGRDDGLQGLSQAVSERSIQQMQKRVDDWYLEKAEHEMLGTPWRAYGEPRANIDTHKMMPQGPSKPNAESEAFSKKVELFKLAMGRRPTEQEVSKWAKGSR